MAAGVRYKDLAPWYDHVESFIGVSGRREGLAQLPDGNFLPPMPMNCVETEVAAGIKKHFGSVGRTMIESRTANLTRAHNGRGQCMYRNRCRRGCPFGAYFSSPASTLPAASQSGNMTLKPNSVVTEVIYDDEENKAVGARVLNAEAREVREYYAKVIFLNASTFVMLNSKSRRFPNGFGNDSGELGHNLMDHHFRIGARGEHRGLDDSYYYGRRPNGVYVPRFRNVKTKHKEFLRGYGYQGGAGREDWTRSLGEMSVGAPLKEALGAPGKWTMGLNGLGEFLPMH